MKRTSLSSLPKTHGSFLNSPINKPQKITKIALALIITFSIVAVTSFVIGTALPLTGFFLEFLSLKLAIIIAFIAHSSSLLSVAVCLGTKILDSLIVNSKRAPKGIHLQKPVPTNTKPHTYPIPKPFNLKIPNNVLKELWNAIIKYLKNNSKNLLPKNLNNLNSTQIKKLLGTNEKIKEYFKTRKHLKLSIKPENLNTEIFKLFPNLEKLSLINPSPISNKFSKKLYNIKKIAFKKDAFTMLKNLKELCIENFVIEKITKNFLPKSIEKIYFKSNYIKYLSYEAFNNLPNLKEVDLSGNTFKQNLLKKNFKVPKSIKKTLPFKTSTKKKKRKFTTKSKKKLNPPKHQKSKTVPKVTLPQIILDPKNSNKFEVKTLPKEFKVTKIDNISEDLEFDPLNLEKD